MLLPLNWLTACIWLNGIGLATFGIVVPLTYFNVAFGHVTFLGALLNAVTLAPFTHAHKIAPATLLLVVVL